MSFETYTDEIQIQEALLGDSYSEEPEYDSDQFIHEVPDKVKRRKNDKKHKWKNPSYLKRNLGDKCLSKSSLGKIVRKKGIGKKTTDLIESKYSFRKRGNRIKTLYLPKNKEEISEVSPNNYAVNSKSRSFVNVYSTNVKKKN